MKKVIIALPGREYSGSFLCNWSQSLVEMTKKGYQISLVNEYSSFVAFSRMKTLGLDVLRGGTQTPFGGEKEYDVWVTIDSDIFFSPEQLIELIEDTDKYPVISGLYKMIDLKHYAAVKEWDLEYFKKNGSYFSYPLLEIETEDGKVLRDMCSEDVAFCKNLKDAGYKVMVNTGLCVGHEKKLVI
jgi:hypothetical protein